MKRCCHYFTNNNDNDWIKRFLKKQKNEIASDFRFTGNIRPKKSPFFFWNVEIKWMLLGLLVSLRACRKFDTAGSKRCGNGANGNRVTPTRYDHQQPVAKFPFVTTSWTTHIFGGFNPRKTPIVEFPIFLIIQSAVTVFQSSQPIQRGTWFHFNQLLNRFTETAISPCLKRLKCIDSF